MNGSCDYLMKGGNYLVGGIVGGTVVSQFDKDLDASLDSFDTLFCRRCLVFCCRLHEFSKGPIFLAEKQTPWCSPDAEKDPCGPNCHILVARSPLTGQALQRFSSSVNVQHQTSDVGTFRKNDSKEEESVHKQISNRNGSWNPLEKSFFEKGLQIFGRKSCLIARNIMNGRKTCYETSMYMNSFWNDEAGDGGKADVSAGNKVDDNEPTRGKVRRLKYKPKSSRYPLLNKIIDTVDGLNPQYYPCGCQSPCVKECGCAINGNTCEKYCGCPKSCINRFRGCNCSKSQCRSRHCPCFVANRMYLILSVWIMMVAGDHRVGVYSKEPIKAGQELFYDYGYSPNGCPCSIESSTSTSKKKDGGGSISKAPRKHMPN